MPILHTPGVYFEWQDRRAGGMSIARADITGFVGIAARGPLREPKRITSWNQFTSTFGSHIPSGFLAYAVEGFFANGGRRCWVVRVASKSASKAVFNVVTVEGDPSLKPPPAPSLVLTAASEGAWAQQLAISVSPVGENIFNLTLRLPDGTEEVWRNLTTQAPYLDLPDKDGNPTVRLTVQDPDVDVPDQPLVQVRALKSNLFSLSLIAGSSTTDLGALSVDPESGSEFVNNKFTDSSPIRARLLPGGSKKVPDPARLPNGLGEFQQDPLYVKDVLNNAVTGSQLVRVYVPATFRLPAENLPSTPEFPKDSGGADGLSDLTPDDLLQGLKLFEGIDEIAILAMPDILPKPFTTVASPSQAKNCLVLNPLAPVPTAPQTPVEFPPAFPNDQILMLQGEMVAQCERLKDRVALLDVPDANWTARQAIDWRKQFTSSYAACYYPWVLVPDPLQLTGLVRAVPPCAHVAGIYGRVEKLIGVHKSPANEIVEGVQDVSVSTNGVIHGLLNDNLVNVIRPFQGRQVRVAGARTPAPAVELGFVNVRRLLIAIERSIRINTQWIVFEPNNPALWLQIDRVLRSFLDGLWKRGFFDGTSPEQAYSVRCDETTNPPLETDNGRILCEIGVLPPWPAEFVIVRIGITEGGVEVVNAKEAQVA